MSEQYIEEEGENSPNPGMNSFPHSPFSLDFRNKGKPNIKKHLAIQRKYLTLMDKLKPVPFLPSKIHYFSNHEGLLRSLGLWDFVHIQFHRSLRTDLIAQLVASYDFEVGCSYVNGVRVLLNRVDLARVFKLPLEKEKVTGLGEGVRDGSDLFTKESCGFIEDIVSSWMLLHEDAWIMPPQVLNWMEVIRDGHLEKVDWAGLFWVMVEKELNRGEQLVDCYYASHLQYLIMHQVEEVALAGEPDKLDLVGEEEEVGASISNEGYLQVDCANEVQKEEVDVEIESERVDLVGEENKGDVSEGRLGIYSITDVQIKEVDVGVESEKVDLVAEERKGDLSEGSLGVDSITDVQKVDVDVPEKLNIELTLGKDTGAKEEIVKEEIVEEEKVHNIEMVDLDEGIELTLGKDTGIGEDFVEEEKVHDVGMMDLDEGKQCEGNGKLAQWQLDAENTVSEHTLQRCNMGVGNELYTYDDTAEEVEDTAEEEEAADTFDILENHNTYIGDSLTSNFLQAMQENKLALSSHDQYHDQPDIGLVASRNDMQHTNSTGPSFYNNCGKRVIEHVSESSPNGNGKRLRMDGPWNNESPNLVMCMNRMKQLITRATMMYEAKKHSVEQSNMSQQILLSEVQTRDNMIEHLRKSVHEELRSKDEEIYRLEREVYVMGNLLTGYREALKQTQKAFAEYRQRIPLPKESINQGAGHGGLMLTTEEVEKRGLSQQEDHESNCLMLEQKAKEAEEWYTRQFAAFSEKVCKLDSRLVGLESEMMKLKNSPATSKAQELYIISFSKTSMPDGYECIENEQLVSKETCMLIQLTSRKNEMADNYEGTENEEPISREPIILEEPVPRETSMLEQPASSKTDRIDNCEGSETE